MKNKPEYDLCIIGGGAAGLVAAAGAATLGAKVVLVEKRALGGDCLYFGCVPSKTLIHSAKIAHTTVTANRFGLEGKLKSINLSQVMHRVADVIHQIEPNDSPERFRALGVNVVFGEGQFIDPTIFRVDGMDITARNFVLATGTRPAIPPIPGLNHTPYLSNETIFSITENIDHLLILGGGPIGCELAQSFARLGSNVSIFDLAPQILPREDSDLSAVIKDRFKQEQVDLHLGIQVQQVEQQKGKIIVHLLDDQQQHVKLTGSHLLIAAGRKPNLENLGLDKANVNLNNGRLMVNDRLRTSNKNIYACGDIASPYQFTHMAEHQAGVVLRNTLFHIPAKVEQRVIPWCTYTDPELARVGISETEAIKQGIKHQVYSFPFADIDRAIAEDETAGLAKIITSPNGKLLGAAIVGAHAGELIAEYVLALKQGMKVSEISNTIHIYPTLAQINRRVADQRLKESLTPTRKKLMKFLFGLRGE